MTGRSFARLAIGVLIAAVSPSPPAGAVDYPPLALECLIAASDAIVVGRAACDGGPPCSLEVNEVVAGERLTGSLRVRVSPWQGRPGKPSGPAVMLLRRTPEHVLEIVGPSAEGWLPVQAGAVHLSGLSMGGESASHGPQPQPLTTLLATLRGLDACVTWTRDAGNARIRATITCDGPRMEALERLSPVARHLVAAASQATRDKGLPCLLAAAPRRRP